MDMAIITEKYPDGRTKTLRATTAPSPELKAAAERLDRDLARRMADLEKELIQQGLLDRAIPSVGAHKPRGSVQLWHAVGRELNAIVEANEIRGTRERRWLWESLSNLHATERIKRVSRGKSRQHFEYCYRIAQFPLAVAVQMYWSEWVYFFDSLTVREEPRADRWLRGRIEAEATIDRRSFRRFTESLNRRLKKMDTRVLTDAELQLLYDEVWATTRGTLAQAAG
jgi:hypothetical protein